MAKIYDMQDQWGNLSQRFTAVKMNATDVASTANSLLLDLQVNGATKFSVDKNGNLFSASGPIGGGGGGGSDTYTPPSTMPRLIDGKLDEYVSITDFYASSDPTYGAAFERFGVWARQQSAAGKGVTLYLPPGGVYTFDHKESWGALLGIKRLHIIGYGASVQNIYDPTIQGAQFGFEMQFFASISPASLIAGYQINTVAANATSVTLKTPADASHFTVGGTLLIGSVDIQGYGQPLNVDRFDFETITAIDAGTGVISVAPQIRHQHRDDFSDGPSQKWGKARVYQLDNVWVNPVPPYDHLGPTFDMPYAIDWHLEGFEIRQTINGNYPYMNTAGKLRTFTNMKLPALSESVIDRVRGQGCTFFGMGEPDKIVDTIEYDSCSWDSSYIFQSSSINRASFKNCRTINMQAGAVKSFYAENCDFGFFSAGALYGKGRTRTLVGCRIGSLGDQTPYPLAYGTSLSVDGTNVTYANGTFTRLKSSSDPAWNVVPGQTGFWLATGIGYSGDTGAFYVTALRDDATYIYMDTTSPFATPPTWSGGPATGSITLERKGDITFIDCYGGDSTRRLSENNRVGERNGEYFKDIFMGQNARSGYWIGRTGVLKRIVLDVKQTVNPLAPASPGARYEFAFATANATTLVTADNLNIEVWVDLNIKGRREYTLTTMTGNVGVDRILLGVVSGSGGTVQAALPANRIATGMSWFLRGLTVPEGYPAWQMPIVEVEVWFDCGMFVTPLVAWGAHQQINTLANVIGQMHP